MSETELRREVSSAVAKYYIASHIPVKFVPGVTPVPVSGRVFDDDEVRSLVDAALDFWLTEGPRAAEFRAALAPHFGARHVSLCNSGSSANLLAVTALTSPRLGERRLRPGDEVVTVAAAFPTTVAPLLQCGLVPVYCDVEVGNYNAVAEQVAGAVGPRTRAIVLAHALGNPFDLSAVTEVARKNDLWLVEDACDALGSTYGGCPVGSFGDLATCSFYPAHHVTTGEGGCVATDDPVLRDAVDSIRDWGRDCWCPTGRDNTCGKRFEWQLGDLPAGYDHKYVYSHLGYNLKMTDLQAAVGVAQAKKLPAFATRRRRNFRRLLEGLGDLEHLLELPRATEGSDPCWFGFPITVREGVSRRDLVRWLDEHRVATRPLFAGNLLRQPAFMDTPRRVVSDLAGTDRVMRDTFWVGVYPGVSDKMVDYVVDVVHRFQPACR